MGNPSENKVVGFQHGLEKSSKWDQQETRVLFLTEGIIMRQAMKTPDINSPYSVVDGCAVLMLDEVHSGSSDMEVILARILPKLKTVTNFKVVLLSATLNLAEFLQRAKDAKPLSLFTISTQRVIPVTRRPLRVLSLFLFQASRKLRKLTPWKQK